MAVIGLVAPCDHNSAWAVFAVLETFRGIIPPEEVISNHQADFGIKHALV
tara:strand:- start:1225 stop:1374 length:150 start_codon:yes stop_codon:yes gene_type:complete